VRRRDRGGGERDPVDVRKNRVAAGAAATGAHFQGPASWAPNFAFFEVSTFSRASSVGPHFCVKKSTEQTTQPTTRTTVQQQREGKEHKALPRRSGQFWQDFLHCWRWRGYTQQTRKPYQSSPRQGEGREFEVDTSLSGSGVSLWPRERL
jgi:hypothetical protein